MKIERQLEDILDQFFNNHEKLERMSKQLHEDLSKVDKELAEFYHKVESTHLSHNTQAYPLIIGLQDILNRRRRLKKETILIRTFLDNTRESIEKAKIKTTLRIKKHEMILKNRKM